MAEEQYVTFRRFMDCKARPSIVRMPRQKGQLLHLLARLRLNLGIRECESTLSRLAGSQLKATGVQSPASVLIWQQNRRKIQFLLRAMEFHQMSPNWQRSYVQTTLASLPHKHL